VTAVVLTYRRPRLASDVVRSLLEVEGFGSERIVVVVNGDGGLDDPDLEDAIERLGTRLGMRIEDHDVLLRGTCRQCAGSAPRSA